MLIYAHSSIWIEASHRWSLAFDGTNSFCLVAAERLAEGVVVLQGDDGLREVVEVTAEDICSIVHSIACPVESFAVPRRGVKCSLELFDSLL